MHAYTLPNLGTPTGAPSPIFKAFARYPTAAYLALVLSQSLPCLRDLTQHLRVRHTRVPLAHVLPDLVLEQQVRARRALRRVRVAYFLLLLAFAFRLDLARRRSAVLSSACTAAATTAAASKRSVGEREEVAGVERVGDRVAVRAGRL